MQSYKTKIQLKVNNALARILNDICTGLQGVFIEHLLMFKYYFDAKTVLVTSNFIYTEVKVWCYLKSYRAKYIKNCCMWQTSCQVLIELYFSDLINPTINLHTFLNSGPTNIQYVPFFHFYSPFSMHIRSDCKNNINILIKSL